MSLREKAKKANVERIINLINDAAEHGQHDLDLGGFDISISEDMKESISQAFDDGEIEFVGSTYIRW
ncbi:MAG: hypothetical protein FWE74_07205 [Oscillospiraceae bacterium]|nr:hypothetical protein [Oscillospiraceae bacterium]